MTKAIEPARFVGGPLDGTTYRPRTKWPQYLNEGWGIILPRVGDRIFSGRAGAQYRSAKSAYALRVDANGVRTYVHSSVELEKKNDQ